MLLPVRTPDASRRSAAGTASRPAIALRDAGSLRERVLEPELLDQPDLDAGARRQALVALGRINRASRTASVLWRAMREPAASVGPRPLRVLDLACGGGQVALDLVRRARMEGLELEVCGCDASPEAVRFARHLAPGRAGRGLEFRILDVLRTPLPAGFDVVYASLFLHHLAAEEAIVLLHSMAAAAGRLVLVSDLQRSRFGFALAWTGCRLLTRSPVVHVDGPRSVRAAFTIPEVRWLATQAGLGAATITACWPQRYLLAWRRPPDGRALRL